MDSGIPLSIVNRALTLLTGAPFQKRKPWIGRAPLLFLCLLSPHQLEMQIWQVTRSSLLNLSSSGCALLLPWHGICTQTTSLTLLGTWTGSHCFWRLASPRNNRPSLPWCCKPFAKRLKLAGQTKGRLSSTCSTTPLSPIKSVVAACAFSTLPVSLSLLLFALCSDPDDGVITHLFQSLVSSRAPLDLCLSVSLCFVCAVLIKTGK